MSLPEGYTDPERYLNDVLDFLQKHKWLFFTPNTHILVENIFSNISKDWLPYLNKLDCQQQNKITTGYIDENWPGTLKLFLQKLNSLKINIEVLDQIEKIELSKNWFDGVNVKKKHEILSFAPIIHQFCRDSDLLVDIGAGLGYLPQILYEKYNYKIIAIEADEQKYEKALERQKNFYKNSVENIKYLQHYVTENSKENIDSFTRSFMKTDTQNIKISVITLHSCADLTIDILKLFLQMPNIKNIVIMPCCYHRMKTNESENSFVNFPLSNSLKNLYQSFESEGKFLNIPFLRLACQNTSSSWRKMTEDEHKKHAVNLLRRNVLQLVAEKGGLQLSRLKRKCKTPDDTTSGYLHELKQNYSFYDPNKKINIPITDDLIEEIKRLIKENEHLLNLFEVFTAFQTALQNICENLILLDRVIFVRENNVPCNVIKVADDELSPRCYALVAKKPDVC